MAQRIIFPNGEGVAVLIPTGELPVMEVARKDVPAGVPFRVIDEANVPADRNERQRWTADFSKPHGFGIGAEAWFAEQAKR